MVKKENGMCDKYLEGYNMNEIKWYSLGVNEVINRLKTNLQQGLGLFEAADRKSKYGSNQVITYKQENILLRFLRQFHNSLIYILLVSSIIAIYLDALVDAGVIFGVMVLNAIFGFIQEGKAEKSLSKIRNMLASTAQVIRDGKKIVIPSSDLVVGDIVLIARGDKVPADVRLCESKNLLVQEAVLTGESMPVEKDVKEVKEGTILSERYSMLYSGTIVNSGYGLGVVVTVGCDTEIGKIGKELTDVESIDTPLLREMNNFGVWLTVLIIVLAVAVFLVGALFWNDTSSNMFMAIVGLTVAAVPEGLPPVISIILAIGVTRMAKSRAIIRRLPAVETMGAVTTICTDKTGTLTANSLEVQTVVTADQRYCLDKEIDYEQAGLRSVVSSVLLCNDAHLNQHNDIIEPYGNPTDVALMNLGLKCKFDVKLLQKKILRTDLIPYETEHKFMATLHHDHEDDGIIYIKGAPEIILEKCKKQQVGNEDKPLDKGFWLKNIENLASLGQRVIAVASKKTSPNKSNLKFSDLEDDLVFIGLFGLIDPPRKEAILAVKECQGAGIKVKMITGDHAVTARAIADQVGIVSSKVLTGDMIDAMSDEELLAAVLEVNVYARTTPKHKIRLVKALQKNGEIVAMTGDGVNDAPALKQSDIGVAMGLSGADVAKETADMVLTDDNFSTIVNAVHEGRTIYDNLKKAVIFTLPTSFAQAFAVIIAILLGIDLPITPVQILWVNMVTAVLLSIPLGFDQSSLDVMQQAPRGSKDKLLSKYLMWRVFLVSLVLVAMIFALFVLVQTVAGDLGLARTVAVNALVAGEVMYLFNCRNLRGSSLNLSAFLGSKPVLFSVFSMIFLQMAFTYLPVMQKFFGTSYLGIIHWVCIIFAAIISFFLIEIEKVVVNR